MTSIAKPLYKAQIFYFAIIFILIFPLEALSDMRNNRFSTSDHVRRNFYLGGNYASDHNSKDYVINFGFRYRSKKLMSKFEFYHKVVEAHTTRIDMRKTKELYNIEFSNKIKIANSNYYFNSFNQFNQDKYDRYTRSERLENNGNLGYYYEMTSVIGFGRVISKNIEADINAGWLHSNGGDSSLVINPTLNIRVNINKDLRITARIYSMITEKQQDDYSRIAITQKITKNLAITLYHRFEREQYIYRTTSNREKIKRSKRFITINFKYYF